MLDQTNLRGRAGDEVGKLSGGNRQRVNIAIGLLAEPSVLLLDEPSSLDPRQREVLWTFVSGLAEAGTAVVYATHNVAEAERYADRVLVLADGELLFSGSPRELEQTGGRRRGARLRGRVRPLPPRAGPTDALAAAQGPADPQALAAARRGAGRLLGRRLAGGGRRALVGPEQAAGRVRQPRAGGQVRGLARWPAGRRHQYADKLFEKVDPIRVDTREEAIAKVKSGEAVAALVVPPDVTEQLQGTLGLGGGGRPTVEVYYNAENPLKRQYVEDTIESTLAEANAAISAEVLKESAKYLNVIVAGGKVALPIVG